MSLGAVVAALAATQSAQASSPSPVIADAGTILRATRAPGASAVVMNVWATWCDPCRAEMPDLIRFFRAHAREGLRLVLVSADDEADRDAVTRFLAEQGVDFPTWMKRGNDMAFIDAIDKGWGGNLPTTFLFDHKGILRRRIEGATDRATLESALLRLRKNQPDSRRGAKP